MGKIVTAPPDVADDVITERGTLPYNQSFWEFLRGCLLKKGDTSTLEGVDMAISLKRKLTEAEKERAPSLKFEDAEFKYLDAACKASLQTFQPQVAMVVRPFYTAISKESVQSVDLTQGK